MLKAMRKNVKSLAPTLWIVIAAFIIAIFAVWGGAGRLGESRATNTIATVGKEKILAQSYYQNLRQRLETLKKEFKDLNQKLIQQLNIPQQVFEQIIQQTLLLQTAKEMGLEASADELREKIISYPVFQKEGKFIGFEEYKKILEWNRTSISEFEESLRKEILLNKVIKVITAGITYTPEELWKNYKHNNESAEFEYVILEIEKFEYDVEPSESEIQDFFENNKTQYKIPEKREGIYSFFETEKLKNEIELAEGEIKKYYEENISQFKEPEKVKVSRIYLAFENKEKELVIAKAQDILERLKAGEDFSYLAKDHSMDEKAEEGGDWGFNEWKQLTSEEQKQIEKVSEGEDSEIIELEDGISILRVTEKTPAATKSLEEVTDKIKTILKDSKARELAEERVSRLEKNARKEKSLDSAAQRYGFKIKKTELLKEGESIENIDSSGIISTRLFQLKEKEISSSIHTYQGVGIVQLQKVEPSRLANLDEVKDEVKEEFKTLKKKEKALEKMKEVKGELRKKELEDLAEKYNLEYKTAEKHKRGQYLSVVGENSKIDELAFSLPLKEASEPIEFEDGYILIKILGRKEVTEENFEKEKEKEEESLLEMKKNKFLQSFLIKMREIKEVKSNYELFLKINSDVLSRYGGEE